MSEAGLFDIAMALIHLGGNTIVKTAECPVDEEAAGRAGIAVRNVDPGDPVLRGTEWVLLNEEPSGDA